MIHVLQDLPDNAIGIEAEGKVTKEDYEGTIKPLIVEKQRAQDKVRLLYVLGDEFEGYTPVRSGRTLRWRSNGRALGTQGRGERPEWIRKSLSLFSWMVPGELKVYHTGEQVRSQEVAIGGMSRAGESEMKRGVIGRPVVLLAMAPTSRCRSGP